ncbi:hypothetical protein RugamoR57_37530 [Duganella caerulea]|uniref:phage protein Gp36 family protein n=1 Tax=Duganella caerulea TaxID=2885762 RepID=UPI0030E7C35F
MTTPAYLTIPQLEALYGAPQIANATAQTEAVLQDVIDAASAYVDGKVRSGYAQLGYSNAWTADVPLQTLAILARPTAALVMQQLYGSGVSQEQAAAAAQAERTLDGIAQGKTTLPPLPAVVDDPSTPDDESDTGAACGSAPRLLGREQLRGW